MSVYLYNLAFSVTNGDAQNGTFSNTGQPGLNKNNAWFLYTGPGLPAGVVDNLAALGALTPSQWSFQQTGDTALNLNSASLASDYILIRVFNWEPTPPSPSLPAMKARVTAVFGKGTNGVPAGPSTLQSPLLMGNSARPVVDFDGSTPNPNWPAQTAGANEWIYCLGGIHGVDNDYTFNVGATVFVPSGSFAGTYAYGRDPQLHIVVPGGAAKNGEAA